MMLLQPVTALLSLLIHRCIASSPADFPTVDLGYARHAPTFVNTTSVNNISFAVYSNIRFAQPPLGDLRFKAPITPPPTADGIQDGVVPFNSTNCLQTWPAGVIIPPGLNGTTWGSEDCLFLDVLVPEGLEPASAGTGVPVLHWVYGGGYFSGAKDWGGSPAALFDGMDPDKKFIAIASNYRLGPFGWISSETEPSITPNAGLYDAWAALQWTKSYAHLLGGDPERVTVMGQSAGGAILQNFLAADAQGRDVPFHQVILSSPGHRPRIDRSKDMTELYHILLDATNCTDVACLRELPEEAMVRASEYMALSAPQGLFGAPGTGYGPVIDGDLVLDLPDRVFSRNPQTSGRISRVITGGTQNEGITYENLTWPELVRGFARTPSNTTIETIRRLYDTPGNQSAPLPKDPFQPTPFSNFYDEIVHSCHSYFTAKYWPNDASNSTCSACKPTEAYRYQLSIPPAMHGEDLPYYFYDPEIASAVGVDSTVVEDVALEFQDYLRRFIVGQDMGGWPEYHSEAPSAPAWINLTADGIETVVGGDESLLSKRCETLLDLLDKPEDGW